MKYHVNPNLYVLLIGVMRCNNVLLKSIIYTKFNWLFWHYRTYMTICGKILHYHETIRASRNAEIVARSNWDTQCSFRDLSLVQCKLF